MQMRIHSRLITESVAIDSLVLKSGLSRSDEPMVPKIWYKERRKDKGERVSVREESLFGLESNFFFVARVTSGVGQNG